jgi:hypothetical protein
MEEEKEKEGTDKDEGDFGRDNVEVRKKQVSLKAIASAKSSKAPKFSKKGSVKPVHVPPGPPPNHPMVSHANVTGKGKARSSFEKSRSSPPPFTTIFEGASTGVPPDLLKQLRETYTNFISRNKDGGSPGFVSSNSKQQTANPLPLQPNLAASVSSPPRRHRRQQLIRATSSDSGGSASSKGVGKRSVGADLKLEILALRTEVHDIRKTVHRLVKLRERDTQEDPAWEVRCLCLFSCGLCDLLFFVYLHVTCCCFLCMHDLLLVYILM